MAKLTDPNTTKAKVDELWKNKNESGFRKHLGASLIGRKCERQLFYTFRWTLKSVFDGRVLRLFDRGQLEEIRFTNDLKGIGCDVHDTDQEGNQWRFEHWGGHFGGDCDGIIASGVPEAPKSPHIAEYKTHSEKSFTDLMKKGVLESKPEHYAQMQTYMGLSGMIWGSDHHIKRALYCAVNKNNDDLYFERIKFDPEFFEDILKKAERIIFTDNAPEGISTNPQWFECKFCDYYGLCHKQEFPEVNCRTCSHSTAKSDGTWECTYMGMEIDEETQREGCGNHIYNPTLIATWTTPVDANPEENWVKYEVNGTNCSFINGFSEKSEFKTSKDLKNGTA